VHPLHVDNASRKLIAIVLMMALLCAQWAGQLHRIVHAGDSHGLSGTIASMQADTGDNTGHDSHHSCSLFDAATLASGIHSAPFDLPFTPDAKVLALWLAFLSWKAPFPCFFSSRAPPRA
jgi:hypothetical protein